MKTSEKTKPEQTLIKKYKYIEQFGYKSIFIRMLIFLLIFSAVILTALYIYSEYTFKQNSRDRLELIEESILSNTQKSMDREFNNLYSQLELILMDESIRAEMTAPDINNSIRTYGVVNQLDLICSINEAVSEAVFYIPTNDSLITSSGTIFQNVSNLSNEKIQSFVKSSQKLISNKKTGMRQMSMINGKLYMMISAPVFYYRVLGVLAFQINLDYLFNAINNNYSNSNINDVIYIVDNDMNQIFNRNLVYPKSFDSDYHCLRSEMTGWYYYMKSNANIFNTSLFNDRLFVLLIISLTILCIAFSVFMSAKIYNPIMKLLHITKDSDHNLNIRMSSNSNNEIELLQSNIKYTLMQNHELNGMIESIRPQMVSDIFRKILLGYDVRSDAFDKGLIYASISGASVAKLFLGGIAPGIIIGALLMVTAYIISVKRGYKVKNDKLPSVIVIGKAFLKSLPALILPFAIMGGIMSGIFTATEAGAMACAYAFILGIVTKELKISDIRGVLFRAAKSATNILLLMATGSILGWILTKNQVPQNMTKILLGITTQPILLMLIVIAFVLFLGCFLTDSTIVPLLTPLLLPVIVSIGYDQIAFGVILCVVAVLGNLTPPVGGLLFVVSGVGKIPVMSISKAVLPFLGVIIFVMLLCTIFPSIISYIPNILM